MIGYFYFVLLRVSHVAAKFRSFVHHIRRSVPNTAISDRRCARTVAELMKATERYILQLVHLDILA